jgi:hypothetical protein
VDLDNLYSCRCGLSCLWTKSNVLADKPDALMFESSTPPIQVAFSGLNVSLVLLDLVKMLMCLELNILICLILQWW